MLNQCRLFQQEKPQISCVANYICQATAAFGVMGPPMPSYYGRLVNFIY